MTKALQNRALEALVRETNQPASSLIVRNVAAQIDTWKERLGRDLNKFEQMVVARPYRWSGKRLTRLIKPVWEGNPRGYVEIDVIPGVQESWEDIKRIRICNSLVNIDKQDVMVNSVPNLITWDLFANVGNEIARVILYGDIFPLIDWDKHKALAPDNNRGVPLSLCTNVLSDEHLTF